MWAVPPVAPPMLTVRDPGPEPCAAKATPRAPAVSVIGPVLWPRMLNVYEPPAVMLLPLPATP